MKFSTTPTSYPEAVEIHNEAARQSLVLMLEIIGKPETEREEIIGESLALALRLYFMGEPFPDVYAEITKAGKQPAQLRAELIETLKDLDA